MNDFAERIKMLMSALNIKTTRQLAEECSIVESTIGRQLKGERPINLDTITSILNSYPNVSAEWLMRGEGSMLKSEIKPTEPEQKKSFLDRFTEKLCDEPIEYLEDMCNIVTSFYRIRKKKEQ